MIRQLRALRYLKRLPECTNTLSSFPLLKDFFLRIYFTYLKDRVTEKKGQTEIIHLLVTNGYHSQDLVRLKPGAWVSHMGGRHLHLLFPQAHQQQLGWKQGSWDPKSALKWDAGVAGSLTGCTSMSASTVFIYIYIVSLFGRHRNREKEFFHLIVHLSKVCTNQGFGRQEP